MNAVAVQLQSFKSFKLLCKFLFFVLPVVITTFYFTCHGLLQHHNGKGSRGPTVDRTTQFVEQPFVHLLFRPCFLAL